MMYAKVRTVLFGELAVAAAKMNELFYEAAIRMNRLQGWAIRHRDYRPAGAVIEDVNGDISDHRGGAR